MRWRGPAWAWIAISGDIGNVGGGSLEHLRLGSQWLRPHSRSAELPTAARSALRRPSGEGELGHCEARGGLWPLAVRLGRAAARRAAACHLHDEARALL